MTGFSEQAHLDVYRNSRSDTVDCGGQVFLLIAGSKLHLRCTKLCCFLCSLFWILERDNPNVGVTGYYAGKIDTTI